MTDPGGTKSRSDGELLRATDTDPEAFGEFYDRHVDDLLRYFVSRTACAHTAADLAAETFAKALLGRGRYNEARGAARAWLFGIAKHELAHSIRTEKVRDRALRRLGVVRPEIDQSSLERIEALLDVRHQVTALRKAISELPVGTRDAVILRVGQELSFREVANRLNCTEGAARVRVTRGLARLYEQLAVDV
jgi:RNA polymerase sigma factor (sigma-70 family)